MTRGGFISLPVGGVSIVGLPWWDLRSPHHASAWRASPRALTRSRALHDGGHWHRRRLGLGGLSLCARREQTFVFSRLALGESRRSCSRALRSERADVRVLALCARREQTFVFSRLALGESRRSCSRALRSERADVRVLAPCARREQTFVFSRFALGESRRSCSRNGAGHGGKAWRHAPRACGLVPATPHRLHRMSGLLARTPQRPVQTLIQHPTLAP
jgi:hypothetical protein